MPVALLHIRVRLHRCTRHYLTFVAPVAPVYAALASWRYAACHVDVNRPTLS